MICHGGNDNVDSAGSGVSPLHCNLKTHEDDVMNLLSVVMTSVPHPRTGKKYIKTASFEFTYKGEVINIDLEETRVLVGIGVNDPFPKVYERSVPLLQILYYVQKECEKI